MTCWLHYWLGLQHPIELFSVASILIDTLYVVVAPFPYLHRNEISTATPFSFVLDVKLTFPMPFSSRGHIVKKFGSRFWLRGLSITRNLASRVHSSQGAACISPSPRMLPHDHLSNFVCNCLPSLIFPTHPYYLPLTFAPTPLVILLQ